MLVDREEEMTDGVVKDIRRRRGEREINIIFRVVKMATFLPWDYSFSWRLNNIRTFSINKYLLQDETLRQCYKEATRLQKQKSISICYQLQPSQKSVACWIPATKSCMSFAWAS